MSPPSGTVVFAGSLPTAKLEFEAPQGYSTVEDVEEIPSLPADVVAAEMVGDAGTGGEPQPAADDPLEPTPEGEGDTSEEGSI